MLMKFEVFDARSLFDATYAVTRNGIRTRCDAGVVCYQLNYQADCELVVLWVDYKPVDDQCIGENI